MGKKRIQPRWTGPARYDGWGLFCCHRDISTCLCGCLCCPCQYAQTRSVLEHSSCLLQFLKVAFCPLCVLSYCAQNERRRMRNALDLQRECCCDCLVWSCFPFCASCEEARELKFRHVGSTEDL